MRVYNNIYKVIGIFTLVLLGCIWAGVFYTVNSERQVEIAGAMREANNYALAFDEHMERTILNADQMLLLLKKDYEQYGTKVDMSPYKKDGPLWNPAYLLVGIADENGDWIISNQEPHIPANLKDREHIKIHREMVTGKIFISKPIVGRASGKWTINMTRRIDKSDGSFGGTVIVGVNPYYFTGFYHKMDLGKNSAITLVGIDGIVRARQAGQNEEVGQDLGDWFIMQEISKSEAGSYIATSRIDNIKRIYSYRHLQNYPYFIIVGLDENEVLTPWRERIKLYYLAAGVITPIILLFSLLLLKVIGEQRRSAVKLAAELNERRAVQCQLVLAKEAAEAANQAKSEFLANMSHEIRTPMNPILGMTELLLETPLNPQQREMLCMIGSSSRSLLGIINDILDFSKIEAGKLALENIAFSLTMLIEDIADLISWKARDKGLTLMTYIDPKISSALRGDPARLRQVILNLVGNAVKFTDKGEIIVRTLLVQEGNVQRLRIEVQDTGIGLNEEEQGRLFQAFTQADGSTTRKYGGTGLGLSISKGLVELMGGQIGVDSSEGQGSVFYIHIPYRPLGTPLHRSRIQQADLRGIRVLVSDDSVHGYDIVHSYIMAWGMRNGTSPGCGQGILDKMRAAAAAKDPYDLVIANVSDDGEAALRLIQEIRQAEGPLAAAKIILLNPYDVPTHREEAIRAGADGYLLKPVRQSQLFDAIAVAMEKMNPLTLEETTVPLAEGIVSSEEAALGICIPQVLLVEDNLANQKLATMLLRKLGYQVTVAANGVEAVALYEQGPDIILMDCQMPEMDGFEATQAIREREKLTRRHIPIIAMTANAMQGDREHCLEAGMDDYLSKPINPKQLQKMLEKYLKEKE